jgi:hypothetical protein
VSPRKHFLLFSTLNPPSVQRVPWPEDDSDDEEEEPDEYTRVSNRKLGRYDTWNLSDPDFDWLVENEGTASSDLPLNNTCNLYLTVTVARILHSRLSGVETWITSDGRAYFVRLQENTNTTPGEHSSGSDAHSGSAEEVENQQGVSFLDDYMTRSHLFSLDSTGKKHTTFV